MSLKQELEKRLMQDMIIKAKGRHQAIVLVVSPHTSKILSSCCRMYDVMEAGVIVIENILLGRQRLELPVIYFLEPTDAIVDRLIADYSNTKHLQYSGAAHLYFTSTVQPELFDRIKNCAPLKAKMTAFVELYVDFLSLESNVFTFDRDAPQTLTRLFPPANTARVDLEQIANQLVSFCLTIKEYPYVRYAGNSVISRQLSTMFEQAFAMQMRKLTDWQYDSKRDRGTLLIVDRSIDPAAPLMHEFTFQAMINDCLITQGEICYLPKTKSDQKTDETTPLTTKEDPAAQGVVLGEDDPLWTEYRHRHISEVMKTLTAEFKAFRNKNAMVKLQQESAEKANDGGKALKEMGTAVKDLAMYKEMMKKYEKHMSLAQECMSMYERRHLREIGTLEQDIATGLDDETHKVDSKHVNEGLLKVAADTNILALERIRLIMLYYAVWGAIPDQIKDELQRGTSPSIENAVRGVAKVGVDLNKPPPTKLALSKERADALMARNKNSQLLLMRYLPVLQTVMEHLVNYTLNEDDFPYVTPPPEEQRTQMQQKQGRSARRKGPADWKKDEKTVDREEDRKPRTIVFVIGGMTYSEMRAAYEVSDLCKSNVFIGSTSTLTVKDFIQGLGSMGRMEFVRIMCESNAGDEWEDELHRLQVEERERREAEIAAKTAAEAPAKGPAAPTTNGAVAVAKPRPTGIAFCWAWTKGEVSCTQDGYI